jgi:hypothetical protein
VATLEVKICRTPQNVVWSIHQPASAEDAAMFASWPGAGERAIAHSMLVEALRREAYMCVLTKLSTDADMIKRYANGDLTIRSGVEKELSKAAVATLNATLPNMIPDVIREILDMVSKSNETTTQNV